jgi:hypothetical protein
MTLTLTNLATGETLTMKGVRPTSDDLAALVTLEGIGLSASLQPEGKYGLASGRRCKTHRWALASDTSRDEVCLDCPATRTAEQAEHDEEGQPPLTPFGEQLMNLGSMLAKDVIKGE